MNNRIIKFRAWDGNNEKFDYFPNEKSDVIEIGRGIEYQQWTGLKDKNEKMIYEGDIISHKTFKPNERTIIKWQKNKGRFNCWSKKWQDWCSRDYDNLTNNREVIGNIFENKNLLVKK